jgi:hypothetical protein
MGILTPTPQYLRRHLISLSDAPNNGHAKEAAKPTLMIRSGHPDRVSPIIVVTQGSNLSVLTAEQLTVSTDGE